MGWEDVKQSWSDGWRALASEADRLYSAAIQENPDDYKDDVEKFMAELTRTRALLDDMKRKIPKHPKTPEEKKLLLDWIALDDRYHELAAGFYADAQEANGAQTPQVGIIPILIVAGLAVGVAGTAWGVAAYEYAVNLREQTEVASKELDARVKASEQGRTLQASTLPPPASEAASSPFDLMNPAKAVKGMGTLLLGGLVLTAGALVIPQLLKKK